MPKCCPRPHRIENKWRPSGHFARRDEVAATVYVMSDSGSDFKNAESVWKGDFKLILLYKLITYSNRCYAETVFDLLHLF